MKNHLIRSLFPLTIMLFIVVICILSSCKKNSYCHLVSQDFKSWTFADQGSYWIYKNLKTGIEDSVFVENDPNNFPEGTCPETSDKEVYDETFQMELVTPFSGYYTIKAKENTIFWFNNKDDFYVAVLMSDTNNPQTSIGFKIVETLPNIVIEGIEFSDVIHTEYKWSGTHPGYYEFYIARHIGIIKVKQRTMESDTTWSLLRWNVIQ